MTFLNFIWRSLRRSSLHECHHGEDPWALVTGGSDGIGKGFVEELLAQRFNVLVHGRSASKLEKLVSELRTRYPERRVELLCYDASVSDVSGQISALVAEIGPERLSRLTVVVNNVGYPSTWTPFALQNIDETDAVGNVQARFPTHLIVALLPHLARNEPSMVMNVAGLTSIYPCPMLAVHSGYKAYLLNWTEAIAAEMRHFDKWRPYERAEFFRRIESGRSSSFTSGDSGASANDKTLRERDVPKKAPRIIWHVINVLNVATSSNRSDTSFFIPSARRMAQAALGIAGCGELHVTAYWRHAMMGALLQYLPKRVVLSSMATEVQRLRKLEDEAKAKEGKNDAGKV